MATNYQQDGHTLDYLNSGDTVIPSGSPVAVGSIVGVAHDNILPGEWGVLHTSGVFVLPKGAEAFTVGQSLSLVDGVLATGGADEPEGGEGGAPTATGGVVVGSAWADAAVEDTEAAVRLGY